VVAGEDERGREVRAGLLTPLSQRRPAAAVRLISEAVAGRALLLALALLLVPASAHAAPQRTGRLLVTMQPHASARALSALTQGGARRDGAQVPQLGLVSVRPSAGQTLTALADVLRGRAGVRRVEVEHFHELRVVPDDPALTTPETSPATPPGTLQEWWIARMNLPAAWDINRGESATVAVIDTGADGGHPELSGKITQAIDNDPTPGSSGAGGDEVGHGTHVSSLACAAGNNGIGIVGAGLDCRLLIFKSDLSDGSVIQSIVQAADLGADAINMSFGTDGVARPVQALSDAIDYALSKDSVPVAAAADKPVEEQGDPANLLQPTGSGPDLAAGRGLTVTAANFSDQRASFAGRGTQISLAAYGSFDQTIGPIGLLAAFPGNHAQLEDDGGLLFGQSPCNCRTQLAGDNRFAYLEGTSMAAPMVAAVAALARDLNPDVHAADVIRALKETATRPPGSGWSPELGWGILNGGSALAAIRKIDRRAPSSKLRGPARVRRARTLNVTWTGKDRAPAKLLASGIAYYDVFRATDKGAYKRIKRTKKTALRVQAKAGKRYRFYTLAVDKAGNREAIPPKADLIMRVDRRR
jgi:subtilisin family serine protease